MTKTIVDQIVRGMKLATIVTRATPWLVEGIGDTQMHVRYVGIKLDESWNEIFAKENNILLKFVIDKKTAYIEYFLANKPPFIKITTVRFSETDKWETLFGSLRQRLKRDKIDVLHHTDAIDNIYARLKPHLK